MKKVTIFLNDKEVSDFQADPEYDSVKVIIDGEVACHWWTFKKELFKKKVN